MTHTPKTYAEWQNETQDSLDLEVSLKARGDTAYSRDEEYRLDDLLETIRDEILDLENAGFSIDEIENMVRP